MECVRRGILIVTIFQGFIKSKGGQGIQTKNPIHLSSTERFVGTCVHFNGSDSQACGVPIMDSCIVSRYTMDEYFSGYIGAVLIHPLP